MRKARFLDKFIERKEVPEEKVDLDIFQDEYEDLLMPEMDLGLDLDLDLDNVVVPSSADGLLIDNTYAENELSDLSKSIFKVEMFINTLPQEMPNDVKRTTVLGILKASSISEEEVCIDALKRLEILESVKAKISDENTNRINEASAKIEQLKAEIDDLNKVIYTGNNELAQTNELIFAEINRIKFLENFIKTNGGK